MLLEKNRLAYYYWKDKRKTFIYHKLCKHCNIDNFLRTFRQRFWTWVTIPIEFKTDQYFCRGYGMPFPRGSPFGDCPLHLVSWYQWCVIVLPVWYHAFKGVKIADLPPELWMLSKNLSQHLGMCFSKRIRFEKRKKTLFTINV